MSVTPTDHAVRRWYQRAEHAGGDPVVAWIEAEVIDHTALEGDEVRYHEPSETCLVRKNDAIVTVVAVEDAAWRTRQAVARFVGGGQQ